MKQSLFFVLIAVVSLISNTTFGSEGGIYKFKADCKMEIVGEPKIHEPFEAIFTFTPRQGIVHTSGISDTAKFNMSEDIEFVKGDTLWIGLLENGKTYTLRAWFIVNDPIYFRVVGSVRTKGATGMVGHKKGTPDPGANAYNGKGSQLFDFREEESRELKKHYLTNDSTIWFAPYVFPDLKPMSNRIGNGRPIIAKMKSDKNVIVDSNHVMAFKTDTNYIDVSATMLESKDTIKFNSKKINILRMSQELRNSYIIKVDGNCNLKMLNDSTYLIDNINSEFILKIDYQGKSYLPPVELLTLYNICGSASFVDNNYNVQSAKNVLVELYNCLNSNCSSKEFAGYTYTDDYGDFCLLAENSHVAVVYWSDNDVNNVSYAEDHDLSEGDLLFSYNYGVTFDNQTYLPVNIPDEYLKITDPDIAGAFNILNTILDGSDYLVDEIGYPHSQLPEKNYSVWDALDNSGETSSFGRFYTQGTYNDIPGFYFASKINYIHNWDEWDESVILHEMGHYVMYFYMESIPWERGNWNYLFYTSGKNNLNGSMSEGWANFFSGIVRNDPVSINTQSDDPLWIVRDYEYSVPDPAYYYNPSLYPANPPMPITPQIEVAHVPGAVTVALWDLYDQTDDDNYFIGPTIWGHNNDHNGSDYWNGIDYIWAVLTYTDPQPNNPDHNFCWNIYEFINGWRTMGYPVDQTFIDIFEAHNVPVFLPGDAYEDDVVNISDVVYIINYKYKNGPAPNHPSSADVNADCGIDILDITYIVEFKYDAGPAPMAGCVNLY